MLARRLSKVLIVIAAATIAILGPALGQTKAPEKKSGRAFLAGLFEMPEISTVETEAFTYTPIKTFKSGDKVAVMMSDDQAWSADRLPLQVGSGRVDYPIFASVKSQGVMPGSLTVKIDLKAGGPTRVPGYQIETNRPLKAGNKFAVFLVNDSILSVESANGVKHENDTKPWFSAYRDNVKLLDRAKLVEAWRVVNAYVSR